MSEKITELQELTKPLAEWLRANHHPHCTIVITQTRAELVEGIMATALEPND